VEAVGRFNGPSYSAGQPTLIANKLECDERHLVTIQDS
jgi:hypothetical protein